MTEKPVTLVTTYRGVAGYEMGLHPGREREVLIAGDNVGGYGSFVQPDDAERAYEKTLDDLTPRMNSALVYLGAKGATPGFEYVKELQKRSPEMDVRLVACDCGKERKEQFAAEQGLQIIWSECGGHRTLGQLVNELLK